MKHSRNIKQGVKVSWSKGIKIIQSLFFYHCNNVRNQYQKIFENDTHIFMCYVTFTKRFDLAIETLNKVKRLKKHRG